MADNKKFQPCKCKIYDCSSVQNLVAGHRYCHALWNLMRRNPKGDFKYTLAEVRAEHACLVRCLKKNGYKHESPLD